MKQIGFVVEGPSDKAFLAPVLYRSFPGCRFDIRVMHGRPKLVRNAPAMLANLRVSCSQAVFFLIDQDDDPCAPALRQAFDENLIRLFSEPREAREIALCVASREIEAWFLADEEAIREVTGTNYVAPPETAGRATKRRLGELFASAGKPLLGLNDIEVAKLIGGRFVPHRARRHSASFDYFWSLIELKVAKLV